MKTLPALLCTAILALVLPACSSAPKKQEASCCAAKGDGAKGKCDPAMMKKHKH